MQNIAEYAKTLTVEQMHRIIKSFEKLERGEHCFPMCDAQFHTEEFMRLSNIPQYGRSFIHMHMLAFECYRYFYKTGNGV